MKKRGAICLFVGMLAIGGPPGLALPKPAAIATSPAGEAEPLPVYYVGPDDQEMNAAILRARTSLPEFYRQLAAPAADEREFMIKFDILPGEATEFVWAIDLDRSAVPMTGILLNQPLQIDHKIGQRVPIAEADIIDWTYRRDGVMQGGYSNRVLLERMPPQEAADYRAYLGW